VNDFAWSPDRSRLAVGFEDGTASVWDVATGQLLFDLPPHDGQFHWLTYSPDGTQLASTSSLQTARLLDATNGRQLLTLSDSVFFKGIFSPDGTLLAFNTPLISGVDVWQLEVAADGTPVSNLKANLREHTNVVFAMDFSPDGTRLATASRDQTVRIWDPLTAEELLILPLGDAPLDIVFNAEGSWIYTAEIEGNVRASDISPAGEAELLTMSTHIGEVIDVDFNPDGSRLAASGADGTAAVWDMATGQALLTLAGHSGRVIDIDYSPDGTKLATASTDGTAIVWDAGSGERLWTLEGHGEGIVGGLFTGVLEVAFSPDGTRLATAGADQTARLWDLASGQELMVLTGHTSGLTNVVFSFDGRLLATGSDTQSDEPDGSVRFWDAETGQELFSLPASHGDRVWGLRFSPDGRLLATAGGDTTVKLWQLDLDLYSGRLLANLTSHNGTVSQVAFSPDGRLLASAGGGESKLWDLSAVISAMRQSEPPETVLVPELLSLPATGNLALSPDGKTLATGFGDGVVRIYVLDLNDLLALAGERLTRSWTAEECDRYRIEPCPAEGPTGSQ
jgi:WD40 repeat protein